MTGRFYDFGKTEQYEFYQTFFNELKKKRKVALRLGHLQENNQWIINPSKTKGLVKGEITIDDLQDSDVRFDLKQKGVDIRLGVVICATYSGIFKIFPDLLSGSEAGQSIESSCEPVGYLLSQA